MKSRLLPVLLTLQLAPIIALAQSTDRFALAVGHALPTKGQFGFFPTIRAEWYVTAPRHVLGLLADAYVARAFPSTSPIRDIGWRWFRGSEYGGALSVVVQLGPKAVVSPYFVAGVLHRVTSQRDSTSTPPSYGVSWGTVSATEPNVGVGTRVRLASGHLLRFEVRYYNGLVFFPLTVGMSF